ncbi:hypothetical protein GTA09_15295 [Rhodococcus hoagii]|nr:hypothetical protein [Prescottella equi]NKZ71060.1 hypothetical protein [Prescottella equi]
MARLKTTTGSSSKAKAGHGPIRAQIIDDLKARREVRRGRHGAEFSEPYSRIIARLEAGESVRLPSWRVRVTPLTARRSGWVELTTDDRLLPVDGPDRS